MMKLFMVLYTATGIGGVWGPLPYGTAECDQRRADNMKELSEKIGRLKGNDFEYARSFRFACELHDKRPALSTEPQP